MGVVTEGTVSGVIPEQRLFAVHYPGYPSSVERAVETLGGSEGIARARASERNFLELRFRPEDPCAHPTFGEVSRSSNLLLRIGRAAGAGQGAGAEQGGPNGGNGGGEIGAEIVGRVDQQYLFDGMADYQYVLAMHADAAKSKKRKRVELLQRPKQGQEDNELMMLVPPLFSLKDMPDEIVLRPVEYTRLRKVVAQPSRTPSVLVEEVGPGGVKCFGLDFKTKEIPPEVNWEEKLDKASDDYIMQTAVSKLFRERPIWAKATLNDKLVEQGLDLNPSQLKKLLFRTAYYFGFGPFRILWIRNGYDPRCDPEARMYQMMDYRVPRVVRNPTGLEPLRGYKEDDPPWKDICSFSVAPRKKFSFLQLYDLEDDYIQAEIRKPAERTTCSEFTGWFRRGTLERMRQHVRVRFLGLIPGQVARALEAAEVKNMQRARFSTSTEDDDIPFGTHRLRMPQRRRNSASLLPNPTFFHPDSTLVDHPQFSDFGVIQAGFVPAESRFGASEEAMPVEETEYNEDDELKEEPDEEEEEDEEDFQEDDLDEEDLSEAAARARYSDVIPHSYLQSLLGKFSAEGGADEQQGGLLDEDVEEYAIYEQDDEDDDAN